MTGLVLAVVVLSACASASGPSVMALPGTGKTFEEFQADDVSCRAAAARQTGTPAGDAYDRTYLQCMYAKGHKIPVPGSAAPAPASANPSAPAAATSWIGTWRGTWDGKPLTLVLLEPQLSFGYGPTGLSGVMTSMVGTEPTSVNVAGSLEPGDRSRTVVLTASSPLGVQRLLLTRVDDNRLTGTGESTFRWGPRGPVDLVRAPNAPPS